MLSEMAIKQIICAITCSSSVSPAEVLSPLFTITSPASLSWGSPQQYRTWIQVSGLRLWDGWRVETIHLKQQKMREIKYLNGTKWCQWRSMFTSYKADARTGRLHPLQWVGSANFDADSTVSSLAGQCGSRVGGVKSLVIRVWKSHEQVPQVLFHLQTSLECFLFSSMKPATFRNLVVKEITSGQKALFLALPI